MFNYSIEEIKNKKIITLVKLSTLFCLSSLFAGHVHISDDGQLLNPDHHKKEIKSFEVDMGRLKAILKLGNFGKAISTYIENNAGLEGLSLLTKKGKDDYYNSLVEEFINKVDSGDESVEMLTKYGYQLLLVNKLESSKKYYSRALEIKKDNIGALFGLTLIAYTQKDWRAYMSYKNKLLGLSDKLVSQNFLLLAKISFDSANYTEVIEYYNLASENKVKSVLLDLIAARSYFMLGNLSESEKLSNEILITDSNNPDALEQLIMIHKWNGDYSLALNLINKLIKIQPNNIESHHLHFELLALLKNYEAAEKYLNEHLPNLSNVNKTDLKAWIYQLKGDYKSAINLITPYLNHSIIAYRSAKLNLDLNEEDAAVEVLTNRHFTLDQWRAIVIYAKNKKLLNTSLKLLDLAIKQYPNNPYLYNSWAWNAVEIRLSDIDLIVERAKKAYDLIPENPAIIDTYTETLLSAKRSRESKDILLKHKSIVENNPQLLFNLAYSYELAGQRNSALKYYRKCRAILDSRKEWSIRNSKDELKSKIKKLNDKN